MSFTFNDLSQYIAQSAPLLGSALAGPAGATIGSLIASKFGASPADPHALHALMTADPQATLKLKELEYEHEIALQQLVLQSEKDAEQILAQDRASARQREAEIGKAAKENQDHTPAYLAYLLTCGLLSVLFWILAFPIPDKNHEILYAVISCLSTAWIGAMAYYHGSSAGSRMKDRQWLNQRGLGTEERQ